MRTNLTTKGFTLIELLIVVAIIAILAAIAVPNFLEAQTRSKVSRTLSDMRTMITAIESYRIDANQYPETDFGVTAATTAPFRRSVYRLTSPIAYLTSIPSSPWKESFGSGNPNDPKIATAIPSYLFVRKRGVPGFTTNDANGYDVNYIADRRSYLGPFPSLQAQAAAGLEGEWLLKSVGPDNIDDRDGTNAQNVADGITPTTARVYDPTNGTVSRGDIVIFSDRRGGSLR